jgi:cytochrome c556
MTMPKAPKSDLSKRDLSKRKMIGIAMVLVVVFAVWGFQIHARRSAEAAAARPAPQLTSAATNDLRQLMETKVHEDFTAMSFTIWHDRPLTNEKMNAIALASGRIMQDAKVLEKFEVTYKQQGWSTQDVQYFADKRAQLSHVAEELNRAAQKHDESQVVSFFMHMDNTCQSCHKRFRPDLSWT